MNASQCREFAVTFATKNQSIKETVYLLAPLDNHLKHSTISMNV